MRDGLLAEQLRQRIRESGMSLSAIARATGISQPQVSAFMSDNAWLSMERAGRICELLGLELVRKRLKSRARKKAPLG
jgi:transcriptional regulator with XRE-family HTH domain